MEPVLKGLGLVEDNWLRLHIAHGRKCHPGDRICEGNSREDFEWALKNGQFGQIEVDGGGQRTALEGGTVHKTMKAETPRDLPTTHFVGRDRDIKVICG